MTVQAIVVPCNAWTVTRLQSTQFVRQQTTNQSWMLCRGVLADRPCHRREGSCTVIEPGRQAPPLPLCSVQLGPTDWRSHECPCIVSSCSCGATMDVACDMLVELHASACVLACGACQWK